jgi:hypothetical protein
MGNHNNRLSYLKVIIFISVRGLCPADGELQYNNMEYHDFIEEMLITANGAASILTGRKGALRVMPTISELEEFLKSKRYGC